jgi:hypothetical protein
MNRLNASVLTAGLVVSPILITVEELFRTAAERGYVENESDDVADSASNLQAVADHLTWWHTAAYLDLAFIFTWAVALLAVTIVVSRTRPVLGLFVGLTALVSVVGTAFHWAFYYVPLASLAQAEDRDLAARAASIMGDDVLFAIALVMFLIGTLLAVLTAGVGLWRAHALPWWGALGFLVWIGYVFSGPESQVAALLNLALLLPFVGVARRLTPAAVPVSEPQPAPA